MGKILEMDSHSWQPVRPGLAQGVEGKTLLSDGIKVVLTRVAPGGRFTHHRDDYGHLFYFITGQGLVSLDEEWLGRSIDATTVHELEALWETHGIHPAGEGGEIETTVLDAPMFRSRLEVRAARRDFHRDSGVLVVERAEVVPK